MKIKLHYLIIVCFVVAYIGITIGLFMNHEVGEAFLKFGAMNLLYGAAFLLIKAFCYMSKEWGGYEDD